MRALRGTISVLVATSLAATTASPARAWGLKTHVWIAQQVLNDALDGSVEIAGRTYRVPDHVLQALRSHPERYRAGVLGPDVYPDPLVGQTTVHPGLAGGWQADDWLEWIAANADSNEEIAFSYGYAAHFAGDIFAHSYVNSYAGDIFELTDGEQEVERRHVVLERYIDSRMPAPTNVDGSALSALDGFRPPAGFLRDHLILHRTAAAEYGRVPTAIHLALMQRVHRAVTDVEREAGNVDRRLQDYITDYMARESGLTAAADNARTTLRLAREGFSTAETRLRTAREGLRQAEAELERVRGIVNGAQARLAEQRRLMEEADALTIRLEDEYVRLAGLESEVYNRLASEWRSLQSTWADLVCKFLDPLKVTNCERKAKELVKRMDGINDLIRAEQAKVRAALDAATQARQRYRDLFNAYDRAVDEVRAANARLESGALQLAIGTARTEIRLAEQGIRDANAVVANGQRGVDVAEAALRDLLEKIQQASVATAQFAAVRALIRNWLRDMEGAAEAYVRASHLAGSRMYGAQGGALTPYGDWFTCHGPVFLGVPRQVGETSCFVRDELSRLQAEIDRFIAGLPEPLRWLIAPSRELKRIVLQRLEPELRDARRRLEEFAAERSPLADLIRLLANPQLGGRDKLNEVFANDGTDKNLLEFDRVADLVDRDAGIDRGAPDARGIPALAHSVTLAKLALLDSGELNRLISDLAPGYTSPLYGRDVYALPHRNFTILHDSVRSLDGNHQWQAYGLPYPRRSGRLHRPQDMRYGRDRFREAGMGLRIWADPGLRRRVFLTLFPTAIVGALGERPELRAPRYPYPSCPGNPFPTAQGEDGRILARDSGCDSAAPSSSP